MQDALFTETHKSRSSYEYALATLTKTVTSAVEKLSTIQAELERHYVSCPGLPPGSAMKATKDLHNELLFALLEAHDVNMTARKRFGEMKSSERLPATQALIEENAHQRALDMKMTAQTALRDSAEALSRLATILSIDLCISPNSAPEKCEGCELCPHLSEVFQK